MNYPHFDQQEFAALSPPCDAADMDIAFMERLERLREAFGKPIVLCSAFRSSRWEREHGRSGTGAHALGLAVDVRISGPDAYHLVGMAYSHGFTGIGVHQTGPTASRYIHLDAAPAGNGRARPAIWSY